MLQTSRLYSFIDQANGLTVHFLEGQKLIHDIVINNKLSNSSFLFYRDILLSTQLLLAYLKSHEGFVVYIDSIEPFLKFKIEMSDDGKMRSLLLPEDLNSFPEKISGTCRIAKFSPSERTPYNSIIKLENTTLSDITNNILSQSYQLRSQIYLSEKSDQSLMISKLPEININKVEIHYPLSVDEYYLKIKNTIDELFTKACDNYQEIQKTFEHEGLLLLSTKEVSFHCSCSKEKMYSGLYNLIKTTGIEKVFMADETEIETKCDYCKSVYQFQKKDFSI